MYDEGFCIIEILYDEKDQPVDYRFLEVNQAFERQTDLKNPIGRTARSLVPEHEEHWFQIYGKVATTGIPVRVENEARGLGRWYEVFAFRVDEPRQRRVAVLFNNITDRKRAEVQARISDRMQVIGTLAGGMAHEINNQMTAVIGFSERIQRSLGEAHEQADNLRLVQRAGRRASDITHQLLAFSRRQVTQPRRLDLYDLAVKLEPVLRHLVSADKTFTITPRSGKHIAMADPAQVEQVLVNLVGNARDATETGDQITIEVKDVEFDEALPDLAGEDPAPPGPYVQLSVKDTGHGMDQQTTARMFEPFFTTKAVGRGSGLGLAMTYGIVKQHGGAISFQTRPGGGTTINLFWPVPKVPGPAGRP